MSERQRHANQKQERARHNMRQKPHLRRERQHRRGEPNVGKVPAEVVDRHADERQAARQVDGVDAARSALIMGGVAQRALTPTLSQRERECNRITTPWPSGWR